MKNRDKNWKISKENIEIIDTNGFLNGEFVIDFENEPEEWEAAYVVSPEEEDEIAEKLNDEKERLYFGDHCRVQVLNVSSFDVEESDLVLNFANAIHPGGGYRNGANAQEETLCRQSTLYSSLSTEKAATMYAYNYEHLNPLDSDYMILSPVVEIFRDSDMEFLLETRTVAVLTVPAPNLNGRAKDVDQEIVDERMINRIRIMLGVAYDYGYKKLTLGAWGCGAFGHDAKRVAGYFYQVLREEGYASLFENITFAVYDNTPYRYNYQTFDKVLQHDWSLERKRTVTTKYKMPCLGIDKYGAVLGEDFGYAQGIMGNGIPFIAEAYFFDGTESAELHIIVPAKAIKSFTGDDCIAQEYNDEANQDWSSVICKDITDRNMIGKMECMDELQELLYENRIIEYTGQECCYGGFGKDLNGEEVIFFATYLHDQEKVYTRPLISFQSFLDEGREFKIGE